MFDTSPRPLTRVHLHPAQPRTMLLRWQGEGRHKGFHRFPCLGAGRSATVSGRTTLSPLPSH